jgi:predicted ferric reductase
MSKKWQRGYGIDDEGRRTIVITENAPQKTPVDRLMELVTHGAGVMIAICALLCVAIMLVESASEGIADFFGAHRWVLVVAIVVAILFFLGKVSARMHGDNGKQGATR